MIYGRQSKSAPVGVVSKVLRILEAINGAPTGLQLREIAQLTGINKSTAYRFMAHLEVEGYLFRDETGAYVVGPKLVRLGSGANYQTTIRTISRPVVQNLWKATSETVNLGVLDGRGGDSSRRRAETTSVSHGRAQRRVAPAEFHGDGQSAARVSS